MIQKTKIVPCLVRDPEGKTKVALEDGPGAFFQHPDWRCTDLTCLIRGKARPGGSAYDKLKVELKTVGSLHGVASCEGGGRAERKHS